LEDLAGVRLAPATVQGDHQLAGEPLAKRVLGEQPLGLGNHLRMTPHGEPRLEPVLEGRESHLFKASSLRPGERLVREIGERRSSPEG
jgi:hypothetical protein